MFAVEAVPHVVNALRVLRYRRRFTVTAAMQSEPLFSPAAGRNKTPIWQVLKREAPSQRRPGQSHLLFLEVASGYGEHVGYFARQGVADDPVVWQPTDYVDTYFRSIAAHCRSTRDVVLPPVLLDVRDDVWPVHNRKDAYWTNLASKRNDSATEIQFHEEPKFDMVLNINMVHISPSACTEGLFRGAGSVLCSGGRLIMYGPFKFGGEHTAPSNAQFDLSLKSMDPDYGVRDLVELTKLGEENGLILKDQISMPANNFVLVFQRE